MKLHRIFAATAALCAPTLFAQTEIALEGAQVPGGEPGLLYSQIGLPVVNNAGQVAFRATFSGTASLGGQSGIVVASGTEHAVVAATGEPLPGVGGPDVVAFSQRINLADDGSVAFIAQLDASAATDGVMVLIGPDGEAVIVAREGDPAPRAGLTYTANAFSAASGQAPLLQSGTLMLFKAPVTDGLTVDDALIGLSGTGSMMVAKTGDAVGGVGTFRSRFGEGSTFDSESLTSSGFAAFGAGMNFFAGPPAGFGTDAIAAADLDGDGVVEIVTARGNRARGYDKPRFFEDFLVGNAGGGPAVAFGAVSLPKNFNKPNLPNDSAGVYASVTPPKRSDDEAAAAAKIKRRLAGNQDVPALGPGKMRATGVPILSRLGRMVMHFFRQGPGVNGSNDTAVAVFDGKKWRRLVQEGQNVPGFPGVKFGGFTDFWLVTNAHGHASGVFGLTGDVVPGSDSAVCYATPADFRVNLVLGELFSTSSGTAPILAFNVISPRSGGADGRPRWTSDHGHQVVLADFDGVGNGVILCDNGAPPVYQPDLFFVLPAANQGDNIYSDSGDNQELAVQPVKGGPAQVVTITVQNDGTAADSFGVSGDKSGKGYDIVYKNGLVDITAQVVAGNFNTGVLQPGASITITAEITATAGAEKKGKKFKVRSRSITAPLNSDVVRIKAKI